MRQSNDPKQAEVQRLRADVLHRVALVMQAVVEVADLEDPAPEKAEDD